MSDEIAFSGPGSPDISNPTSGGNRASLPEFFNREGNDAIERELSPAVHATAKEEAARLDAIAGDSDGRVEQTAPKL